MKIFSFVGFVTAMVCLPMAAPAQDMKAYVVATNFSAQGKVIELDIPTDMDGSPFLIVWNAEDRQYRDLRYARAGTHGYEIRHRREWQGYIKVVAVTLEGVPGRIKQPTFSDEIDMFLAPQQIRAGTINFLEEHTLFTWSWNTFLLLILLLSALWIATLKKRSLVLSLLLGFLASWGVMDLRTIYDHVVIVYKMEKYRQGMFPVAEAKVFADRASEVIGRATWGTAPLVGVAGNFVRYRLAEQQYVPEGTDGPPAFWITQDPKQGQVLWQYGSYYLVKKNQP